MERGETIAAAAARELQEEAGLQVALQDLHHAGILHFEWGDERPQPWEVHVFRCTRFAGEPTASDEMAPAWYYPHEVPLTTQMWADDKFW